MKNNTQEQLRSLAHNSTYFKNNKHDDIEQDLVFIVSTTCLEKDFVPLNRKQPGKSNSSLSNKKLILLTPMLTSLIS